MPASSLVLRDRMLTLIQRTVKKVRLKTMQSDTRIFREVNALSRLSHRFIVRYYTTWVETSEPTSTAASDDSGTESGTEDAMTSVPESSERSLGSNDPFHIDLDDLDDLNSRSKSSFPSIHFRRSTSGTTEDDDSDSDDAFGNLFGQDHSPAVHNRTPPPVVARTLYIQMASKLCSKLCWSDLFAGIC
jgi:translation initiation factor 2-alpha kinase 4